MESDKKRVGNSQGQGKRERSKEGEQKGGGEVRVMLVPFASQIGM